jgi:regulator of cell morphogenesis and NO signaling
MNDTVQIDPVMTVNEVIQQVPQAVAVFKRYGIDACCGGGLALGVAAERHGHDVVQLIAELQQMAGA